MTTRASRPWPSRCTSSLTDGTLPVCLVRLAGLRELGLRPEEGLVGALRQLGQRLGELGDRRAELVGGRAQGLEVEAVELRRVAGEDLLDLLRLEVAHDLAQVLPGEGVRPLLVRVVAAPHHAVDADGAEGGLDVGRGRLADAD